MKFAEAEAIIKAIRYRDVRIELRDDYTNRRVVFILQRDVEDANLAGRRIEISSTHALDLGWSDWDETRLVDFVWMCIKGFELHEAGEWFLFRGQKIFDPHKARQVP